MPIIFLLYLRAVEFWFLIGQTGVNSISIPADLAVIQITSLCQCVYFKIRHLSIVTYCTETCREDAPCKHGKNMCNVKICFFSIFLKEISSFSAL